MNASADQIPQAARLYASNPGFAEVENALDFISPDMYRNEWVKVAMSIKSEFGDSGYMMFDTWSQGSHKYIANDCQSTWRSINGTGGMSIATLFMMAKEGGYKPMKNGIHKPFKATTRASKPSPVDEPKDITKSCEKAQKYWDESAPDLPHPYAEKKGFPDHGLRVNGNWLLIPAYNSEKQIQSIQRISSTEKLNLKGCTIKGTYYPIGGDKSTLVICEGWATGMSINAATGYSVAVAFGKGNLKCVAKMMIERRPKAQLIVAADNDHVVIAQEAAMAVSGLVAVPQVKTGTDFNDLHLVEGLETVKSQFQECIDKGYVSYGSDSGKAEINWPDPELLPTELRQVPDFDFQLLPANIRDWVADIADRQGCPPEFPAVTALVHMGAIIGRKIGVRPKRNGDSWTVVSNLWGAVVGPPSLMKSPAIREARLPFKIVENRLLEDTEAELIPLRQEFTSMKLEYDAEEQAVKLGWKNLKLDKTGKTDKFPDRAELNERSADLSITKTALDELERKAFAIRRIEVNDPTPEALQVVLSNNPNGIIYFNDELTSWLETLEKSGREGSRQMHLEMADGTDTGSVDRIGRGHVEYNKIESIFGSIQPGPLGCMVDKALSHNKSNDGLIQRFQLLVWRNSFNGKPLDSIPDSLAAHRAEDAFVRLYAITPEDVDCHDAVIPYLHLSPDAYAIWWAWYENLQVTASRYSGALTSHMMKYPSMVISLALIDHLADGGAGDIGTDSMQRAFGLMNWLWEHAQRIYSATGHSKRSRLRNLATRIQCRRLGDRFTLRELKRQNWTMIHDDAELLLEELVDMNWLGHEVSGNPNGGPKSHVYTVNPKVFKVLDLQNPPPQLPKLPTQTSYDSYGSKKQQCGNENCEIPDNISSMKDKGVF